jgi:hypothetical protein
VDDKIATIEREVSQRADEMKREQRKEFERSKQELLRYIRWLLSERRPRFMELRGAIASYESDIDEFRSSHQKVLEEMDQFRSEALQKRRVIMAGAWRCLEE